jgi:hypothetical protein
MYSHKPERENCAESENPIAREDADMGNAEDWARLMGEQIKAEQQESDLERQRTEKNRASVDEQMPLLWEEICKEFDKHCTAFNEQTKPQRVLVFHRLGPLEFRIHPDAMGDVVIGKYTFDTKHIVIRTDAGEEWFSPEMTHVRTGKVILVSENTRQSMSLESIAQKAIGASVLRLARQRGGLQG